MWFKVASYIYKTLMLFSRQKTNIHKFPFYVYWVTSLIYSCQLDYVRNQYTCMSQIFKYNNHK